MAVAEPAPEAELARLRKRLLLGATGALAGIAWSVVGDETVGGWLVVVSFTVLVATAHKLGRTGPS